MTEWQIALQMLAQPTKETQRVHIAGCCKWCGKINDNGLMYCDKACMRSYHNFQRPTTRKERAMQ